MKAVSRCRTVPASASYVALAEALGTVLLAADGRLERAAGIRCEIAVLS
jgi:predicted nucleic acid-binding protein